MLGSDFKNEGFDGFTEVPLNPKITFLADSHSVSVNNITQKYIIIEIPNLVL